MTAWSPGPYTRGMANGVTSGPLCHSVSGPTSCSPQLHLHETEEARGLEVVTGALRMGFQKSTTPGNS